MSSNDHGPTAIQTLPAVLARDLIRVEARLLDDPPAYCVMVGAAPAGEYATAGAAGAAQDALAAALAELAARAIRRHDEQTGAPVLAERARSLLAGGVAGVNLLDALLGACVSPTSAALRVLRYVVRGEGMPAGAVAQEGPTPSTRERCGAPSLEAAGGGAAVGVGEPE